MAVVLLDVNVLLALCWPSAEAHIRAQDWFRKQSAWATCPLTQVAFVRILSNPSFSRNSLTPLKAESLLRENLNQSDHHFWPDELNFHDAIACSGKNIVGHRQITDAYLLGLAISHKAKLATFDLRISSLLSKGEERTKYIEEL